MHLLDSRGRIERVDSDSFVIWGLDPILKTDSAVGIDINKKGKITTIDWFSVGEDPIIEWDNQYMSFDVRKPQKAIKWFTKQAIPEDEIMYDPTNPQPFADAFDKFLPGLAGGPTDVYVSFGDYYAYA
mgnify:CR=1 FL=1